MNYNLINFCEFDKYASKSYCAIHNVDESLNLGDVTKVNENSIDDFDLLVGGSPCQDFSIAGKQEGAYWTCGDCEYKYNPLEAHYTLRHKCPQCNSENITKTRSSLLVEYLRILKEKMPKFAIYENVKNIISKNFEQTFHLFISELQEYGYNTYYQVLNAKDYNIPQNRERVFIISIRKDIDNCKFEFPKKIELQTRTIDLLEDNVDKKYYINKEFFLKEGNERHLDRLNQIGELNIKGNDCIKRLYSPYGLSPTITTMGGGNTEPKIVCEQRTDEGLRFFKGGVCGTLRTVDSCGDKRVLENKEKIPTIRKLTPLECWRLMGFDDSDFENALNSGMSNSQLYKQAGNSIVVNVLTEIYKELHRAFPNDFCDGIKLTSLFSGVGAFEKAFEKI